MRSCISRTVFSLVISLASVAMTADDTFGQVEDTGNLVENGQFEEGDDDAPDGWSQGANIPGVEYIWDKENGHDGGSSLCLHKTAQKLFPIAQWFQIVDPPTEEDSISVSAQVKAEDVTKAIVDVVFLDDSGEWIKHEWVCFVGAKTERAKPADHDWKEYSGKVDIPRGTKQIQVNLQMYGPGKVWFDNVRVSAGDGKGAKTEIATRMWTDATGKYKIKGTFVSLEDDKVTIKRDDNGKEVTLELSRLSKKCQKYVKSRN